MNKDDIREAYVDLCVELGFDGNTSNNGDWGDQYPGGDDHFDSPVDIANEPIALVERSRYGQVWVTLHSSLDDACRANTNQEYAEDWTFPDIIDLRTGDHYEVEYRAVAVKVPREVSA